MPALKKTQVIPKPVSAYTYGLAVPKGGRRACYDPKTNTYTREACQRGYLIGQGIGVLEAPAPIKTRAFSKAFSNGFS